MSRGKILSFSSFLMGLFLLVLFFMPWLELSCVHEKETKKLGEASGWQIALGRMTGYDKQGKPSTDPDNNKKLNDPIRPRPWFLLALAAPLVIAVVALAAALGRIGHSQPGWLLTVLGLVGLAIVLLAFTVDYSYDVHQQEKDETRERLVKAGRSQAEIDKAMAKVDSDWEGYRKEHKETGKGYETSSMVWLWMSLVVYVVVMCLAVAGLFLGRIEENPGGRLEETQPRTNRLRQGYAGQEAKR